jgi:phosphate starvation-inducible protein PhoH
MIRSSIATSRRATALPKPIQPSRNTSSVESLPRSRRTTSSKTLDLESQKKSKASFEKSLRRQREKLAQEKNKKRSNSNIRVRMGKKKERPSNGEPKESKYVIQVVVPRGPNQTKAVEAYRNGKNLFCHGYAGTGKSFLTINLALKDIIDHQKDEDYPYKKLKIIRSIVPSRDPGFLPGSLLEKTRIYEEPYYSLVDSMFDLTNGYDALKSQNKVEFTTTSFLRGTTFNDCIVLVDEIQNMTWGEIQTIITRAGLNCRMIFCGDFLQTDLTRDSDKEGLKHFREIVKSMKSFESIEFEASDIQRSDLVKEFIINSAQYFRELTFSTIKAEHQ